MPIDLPQPRTLLVVRELGANLPLIGARAETSEDVIMAAQLDDERHDDFHGRVLERARQRLRDGHALRAAISLAGAVDTRWLESRRRMVRELASLLASSPPSELVVFAPAALGTNERSRLFGLVEAAMWAAPTLDVRLEFSPAPQPVSGHPSRHERRRSLHQERVARVGES